MTAAGALTDAEVVAVRRDAAADKPVTVWFTTAAVGVPAGRSAKVVAVGDSGDGDFIQVRPAGSRDTMFCSPGELTRVRPARRRAAGGAEKAGNAPTAVQGRAPGKPPAIPVPEAAVPAAPAGPVGAARPGRVGGARGGADRPGAISVSLKATAEGEWTVEVVVGKKRVVASTPVQAAEVATAARSLPPAVAEVIESSLEGARQRQRDRVERLRAELDAAQRVLDQFGV